MAALLLATNIHKSYGSTKVLNGVDLKVQKGEIICLMGLSGAGKSTLLHILGLLDTADSGKILLDDLDYATLRNNKAANCRNQHIGFIFQSHCLLPEFSAIENVAIPAMIGGISKKIALAKSEKLLERLGLQNRLLHRPNELSGGEQQRVAVARALINEPKIVLADEPSGNLDMENALSLHQLFIDLRYDLQQTFIIVSHNPELAKLADNIVVLQRGRIT